ncbi:LysR family transcriptional regulator [Alkalihalobacillus sp. AL-G]|uniref:LysR family transcriptional regulator n=1 Tax=Alkalihalobacillus sp. AL-G TaxID=2926399 RepID=UPI002729CA81|nr:LysR family transcriptional regulator [Alkalihalobacillus sp. AL-G]WLD94444.1 LysR substrate-binding domain-containing protein [Alkalihalobacillus sp. AL-G]
MDIRHLEYFTEVARHLSFTKAASVLHVSQPSISKAIKHIEEELGVSLFYRSKHLELTDAGKAVLENAKHVLEAFNNLTSELTDVMDLKKGEIRIGIPPIIGAAFFSKLISRFKEDYPYVQITLTEVGSKKIKQGVEDGSLDIGLICNLPIQKGNFEIIKVINDPLMLIVHKEHPLANQEAIDLSDLKSEPFILYRQDFTLHDRIVEECSKKGFHPNVVCESSQKDFMIEMVEARLGIALLPGKVTHSITNQDIIALPLSNSKLSLELGMVWKRNKYLPFAVREFIEMSKGFLP